MHKIDISFTPRSLEQLKEISSYLQSETGSKRRALAYIRQLKEWIKDVLGTFPEAGKVIKIHNRTIHQLVLSSGHKGYRIFYQLQHEKEHIDLIILALFRENFSNDFVLKALIENDS